MSIQVTFIGNCVAGGLIVKPSSGKHYSLNLMPHSSVWFSFSGQDQKAAKTLNKFLLTFDLYSLLKK